MNKRIRTLVMEISFSVFVVATAVRVSEAKSCGDRFQFEFTNLPQTRDGSLHEATHGGEIHATDRLSGLVALFRELRDAGSNWIYLPGNPFDFTTAIVSARRNDQRASWTLRKPSGPFMRRVEATDTCVHNGGSEPAAFTYSPKKIPRRFLADTTATGISQSDPEQPWLTFLKALPGAALGGFPPTTPSGPGGVTGLATAHGSRSYVFKVRQLQSQYSEPVATIWILMHDRLSRAFPYWESNHHPDFTTNVRKALLAEENAKAIAAVASSATVEKSIFLQESPAGGVRVSLVQLAVNQSNGTEHIMVITISHGTWLTTEQRKVEQARIADLAAHHQELEHELKAEAMDEPAELREKRGIFIKALAEKLASPSSDPVSLLRAIDQLPLPAGVKAGISGETHRSFILMDTSSEDQANETSLQFSDPLITFVSDSDSYKSVVSFLADFPPIVEAGDRALAAVGESLNGAKRDVIVTEVKLFESKGRALRGRYISYVQLHLQKNVGGVERYVLVLNLSYDPKLVP